MEIWLILFAKMLDDPVVEIRSNALFFIEELPEEYFPYLGSKIKKLLEFLDETDHSSVIEAVLHILSKLWKSSSSYHVRCVQHFDKNL